MRPFHPDGIAGAVALIETVGREVTALYGIAEVAQKLRGKSRDLDAAVASWEAAAEASRVARGLREGGREADSRSLVEVFRREGGSGV